MSPRPTPLLLVHGFWFGSWCWSEVIARVAAAGRVAQAVDLAGHGLRARWPKCLAQSPENADSLVAQVMRGDPGVIGALRIDLASADADYRRRLRAAYFDDIAPDAAEAAIGLLTPDSPLAMQIDSTRLTRDGWGSVPRTYVVCEQDWALRPAVQRRLIAEADAAFPENPTSVVTLDSSHSPFLSMPGQVADIFTKLH
ncbi:alpha/beta fold hydrolase [Actinomadura soli]|nr:alpha/beta fold hydrolase [Actinomadura soli]